MKEKYENVEMEVIEFEGEDIVRTSGEGDVIGGAEDD